MGGQSSVHGTSGTIHGQPELKSVEPGVAAGLFEPVDTSRTQSDKVVPPDVAKTRAEMRKMATAGTMLTGGALPWYATQAIDKRTLAGVLLSAGGFLPLVFRGRRQ